MRTIRWLGQTIDNACMQACNLQYGATSKKPDPAALIACFVTQCSGSGQTPAVVPPPGFTLPAGMTLPPGFTIPAGWTLPAGLPLPPGNLPGGALPPGWTLPTSIIPPGFTLPTNWTLPNNWTLPGPLTLPVPLTVPPGVPVPPNLPTVPPPAQTAPPPVGPITPAPAEKKSDNTVLWVVGGVAAVGLITVLAMSSKSIGGGMLSNPKGNEPWQFRASGMGRRESRPGDFVGPAQLQRVPLNGDYDPGGAYWGGGRGTQPLYAAWDEDGNAMYTRAGSRADAKQKLMARGLKNFKR